MFDHVEVFEDVPDRIPEEYLICNAIQGAANYLRAVFGTNRSKVKRTVIRAVRAKFGHIPVKRVFASRTYYCTEQNIECINDQVDSIVNISNEFQNLFRIIEQNRMIQDYPLMSVFDNWSSYSISLTELHERIYQASYKQSSTFVKYIPLSRRSSTEIFKCLRRRYERATSLTVHSRLRPRISVLRYKTLSMKEYPFCVDRLYKGATSSTVQISISRLRVLFERYRTLRMKKYHHCVDHLYESMTTFEHGFIYNKTGLCYQFQQF
ncbi:hypothetical protein GWI33_003493 [Rhynchophorus ferrugineus]|uniref:Uncharacterized protein n=1 Tax=Rhynchophorus ferrugineus TaxID=354439 RepID=A0A834HJD0_RHYFE|nr:hypothetical protein GWI33_003493 [Rhynchophorus ferrugineus]